MFFRQLATRESSLSYFFGCGGCGAGLSGKRSSTAA